MPFHFRTVQKPVTTFLLTLPIIIFTKSHVIDVARVSGPSMSPTLNTPPAPRSPYPLPSTNSHTDPTTVLPSTSRDFILISKWNTAHKLRRGQIVVLRSPINPEAAVVKRVIGLEGDVVRVKTGRRLGWQRTGRGGSLYGRALMPGDLIVVPPGHCWVEGDGEISRDSNDFGAVSISCVQGRVAGRLFPSSQSGILERLDESENMIRPDAIVKRSRIEMPPVRRYVPGSFGLW
ncbi:LexA/Signal peptidase [Ascodesmis nigricans]|uniref:Mitochondrial inner membrane protease subunit n=1 Tax=Ascodesmis nigricans TaxID=341454 RepID=A0A4S2N4I5_9PEZI|nr:LexA/Signal peptidase [Ascodesmis nigricans]